jgi:hypothetical protein
MSEQRRLFVLPGYQEPPTDAARAVAGPFDVPATNRGATAHFTVYYETRLGAAGAQAADDVLKTCETDNDRMSHWFAKPAQSFNVIVLENPGGAYHYGCKGADLYCDATGGGDRTRMLTVAEAVEVYEAKQRKGWNCGASAGEGLSRTLATELYPKELDGFASASAWLNSTRPDWVSRSEATDTDYISIGCSVLFLNYLRNQLGHSWDDITQAAGSTLEKTYQRLTKKTGGFAPFRQLLDRRFPPGTSVHLPNDNSFPL